MMPRCADMKCVFLIPEEKVGGLTHKSWIIVAALASLIFGICVGMATMTAYFKCKYSGMTMIQGSPNLTHTFSQKAIDGVFLQMTDASGDRDRSPTPQPSPQHVSRSSSIRSKLSAPWSLRKTPSLRSDSHNLLAHRGSPSRRPWAQAETKNDVGMTGHSGENQYLRKCVSEGAGVVMRERTDTIIHREGGARHSRNLKNASEKDVVICVESPMEELPATVETNLSAELPVTE